MEKLRDLQNRRVPSQNKEVLVGSKRGWLTAARELAADSLLSGLAKDGHDPISQ